MSFIKDQLQRTIEINKIPKRIISIVPSQTELLFDLGLDKEVIGITKFCVHPAEWFKTKTRIGGTKKLDLDKIKQLHPDIIFANKEENSKEQIEELAKQFPVWISDVNSLDGALEMIEAIGTVTSKQQQAEKIKQQIKKNFSQLITPTSKSKACYLIWKDPYMTVGGDAFIHEMITRAGFQNVFAQKSRYPQITIRDLQHMNCELLFLSSEPYPFKQKHLDEFQQLLPNKKILLVDGEMFSWYGSRLIKAPAYFQQLAQQIAAIS